MYLYELKTNMNNFMVFYCCAIIIIRLERAESQYPFSGAARAYQEYNNLDRGTTDKVKVGVRIIDGTEAMLGEFPYMAALGYSNRDRFVKDRYIYRCGGSLISSTYVLTAGHCIDNLEEWSPIVVKLGFEDIRFSNADTQVIRVDDTISHPDYRRSRYYNDIGLVKLGNKAKITNNVKPICLQTKPFQNFNFTDKTSFVVMGVGATELLGPFSGRLRKTADLTLMGIDTCRKHHEPNGKIPLGLNVNFTCAFDEDTTRRSDACEGDSGSPLVMIKGTARTLIGITVFGEFCGSHKPGVYISIPPYLRWIESSVSPEKLASFCRKPKFVNPNFVWRFPQSIHHNWRNHY